MILYGLLIGNQIFLQIHRQITTFSGQNIQIGVGISPTNHERLLLARNPFFLLSHSAQHDQLQSMNLVEVFEVDSFFNFYI